MLALPQLSRLVPRVPKKEKTLRFGNPQPLWEAEEEEEHREEADFCEALLESRAMNEAQEAFGVVVANMLMFCVCLCVFVCVYVRACLSCEEKSASLSIRFFASKKRQKIRTRAARSKHTWYSSFYSSFGERASAAPFPAFYVVVCKF